MCIEAARVDPSFYRFHFLYFSVSCFGKETSHCWKKQRDFEWGGQTGQSEHHAPAGKRSTGVRVHGGLASRMNPDFNCGLFVGRMSWLRQRGAMKTSSAWWATTCVVWTRLWASRERKLTHSNWAARYKTLCFFKKIFSLFTCLSKMFHVFVLLQACF